jgi:DNA mismatch repair ATPase MutL
LDKLQFRVSSELKNIIGRDLITDDFIAISELVKNSYDANAKKVEISFRFVKRGKNATILITDDGDGMTFGDLKEKWLLVGYSKKVEIEKEFVGHF